MGMIGKSRIEAKPGPGDGKLTLYITRVFKAPRARVFRAFADPDAYAKWLPPDGFTAHIHKFDFRAGGAYRMSFTSASGTWSQAFGGKFLEVVPNERIVHTDAFETDDPGMQGEMRVTITFRDVPGGTEVTVVQEGVPKPAAEGAPQGWSQSLDNLARLVEPELPF